MGGHEHGDRQRVVPRCEPASMALGPERSRAAGTLTASLPFEAAKTKCPPNGRFQRLHRAPRHDPATFGKAIIALAARASCPDVSV